MKRPRHTPERKAYVVEAALALQSQGRGQAFAASLLNVSPATLNRWLKQREAKEGDSKS